MPKVLAPRPQDTGMYKSQGDLINKDYGYHYPRGVKLKPGTPVHDRIKDEVLDRAQLARNEMQPRYDAWRKLDEQLTTYIPLSEYDKNFKGESIQTDDPNKPISIVVPVSQAVLETMLSYLVTAFLDEPILKYEGIGPEDQLGAAVLEQVIMVQTRKAKMGLSLHTMFRDGLVYGLGSGQPTWTRRTATRRTSKDSILGIGNSKQEVVRFEGNVLHNIDPYSLFPDVSVSPHEIQRGEFYGYLRKENVLEILSRERLDDNFFNAKYLTHIDARSHLGTEDSARDKYGIRQDDSTRRSPADTIYMAINIIPKDWNIGIREYPEWWLFAVTGDSIVISAQPLEFDHGMLPFVSFAPTFDGYSSSPISSLENIYGMQHLVNFLYNSHIANVRKAINNMFVVDPELVNMNDLKSPAPGRPIRLRKKAWGRGVQDAISQLKVDDITAHHIQDAGIMQQLIQNYSGATDALQGIQRRSSERVSATEFRDTRMAALNRIERLARLAGMQVFQDLGEQYASNTQQFMSEDTWIELKGRHEDDMREILGVGPDVERVHASPEDLLIDFDVLVSDGSLPNSGDPQLWLQALTMVGQNEYLLQDLDITRIFKYWAKIAGAKNIEQFSRRPMQAQVIPDEEAAQQAQAGNLVPLGG